MRVRAALRAITADVGTLGMLLCTVAVLVLGARRLAATRGPLDDRELIRGPDEALIADSTGGHLIGGPSAPVQAVAFIDYQCEVCALFHQLVSDLQDAHPSMIAIRYRHYPLSRIHPEAMVAATGAECAAEQARFEAWHATLLARQADIGGGRWTDLARRAGIPDTLGFVRCLAGVEAQARVAADRHLAVRLGLRGTPAVVVWRTHLLRIERHRRDRLSCPETPVDVVASQGRGFTG